MKLQPITLLFFIFMFSINGFSQSVINTKIQDTTVSFWTKKSKLFFPQDQITTELPDTISYWKKTNRLGFDISEIAFVNWSAGGTSSISGLLKGNFSRIYAKKNRKWVNELMVRYGMNKQDGIELRKTDDAIQFNSTFGYRKDSTSNWYHSAKLNFNTQFSNGYSYPNKEIAISKPFAPAYLFMGVGGEYSNKEMKMNLYVSPFTLKTTMVLDQRLADQGAFGVEKAVYDADGNLISNGKKSKNELGFLLTSIYKKEIFKNINFENRLSLYSDYINKFGNVDIDCDLLLDLVVNQYVRANIGTRIVYDDDIKNKKEIDGAQVTQGPKTQLKQVLGVGLTYVF
jgi:hypothetical protein